nr:unnamed protein product [Anser cygnoides domesticus]
MQDEILIKNGEIKILRDSMQQMEYAMEEQKKSYMLLEQQKSQTLKEKEREFSKKILSLQSELQFKDAEMNELRTRLQNCERNKHVTQTVLTPRYEFWKMNLCSLLQYVCLKYYRGFLSSCNS